MKLNKRIIIIIIGIFLGIILVSGVSVYATYEYFANNIKYTQDKTIAQALNELYDGVSSVTNNIENTEKNWTLVITYKIYLGWNGNSGYGSQNGRITVQNVNGTKTITNENGTITSPTERWNGDYYINARISDVAIESFTIDE